MNKTVNALSATAVMVRTTQTALNLFVDHTLQAPALSMVEADKCPVTARAVLHPSLLHVTSPATWEGDGTPPQLQTGQMRQLLTLVMVPTALRAPSGFLP